MGFDHLASALDAEDYCIPSRQRRPGLRHYGGHLLHAADPHRKPSACKCAFKTAMYSSAGLVHLQDEQGVQQQGCSRPQSSFSPFKNAAP